MTKKNPKRSLNRKEQSERDKLNYLSDKSIYGQLAAFQQLLGMVHHQGMNGHYVPIPYELIDFTASFIASVMKGVTNDLIFMTSSLTETRNYRDNVNFIRKTLSKAQVGCSSLICSLWYIDHYFQQPSKRLHWHPRDLFVASIIVADKYLADITWLNSDWSEWTQFNYTAQEITQLEKRFLKDINYQLFVSELDYRQFVSYLEFKLHARQLFGDALVLSYRDIDVLSQALNPIYVERLQLNLRPFEAMLLLAKQATSIFFVYAATVVTLVSAGYILSHHVHYDVMMTLLKEKEDIAMMVMTGIDLFKATSPTATTSFISSGNLQAFQRQLVATLS